MPITTGATVSDTTSQTDYRMPPVEAAELAQAFDPMQQAGHNYLGNCMVGDRFELECCLDTCHRHYETRGKCSECPACPACDVT